jgi:hypothetical protein
MRRVDFGMRVWGAIVVKNGQVDEFGAVTFTLGQRADPCSR